MYFVNREHRGEADNILAFVAAVASTAGSAPARTARTPHAMTVPLVDREEYREIIAESLEDFVQKEARALVEEMASLTRGQGGVGKRRILGRVRAPRDSVEEYEELLETRSTEVRANLEVASKQARALLALVTGD